MEGRRHVRHGVRHKTRESRQDPVGGREVESRCALANLDTEIPSDPHHPRHSTGTASNKTSRKSGSVRYALQAPVADNSNPIADSSGSQKSRICTKRIVV